MTKRGAIIIGFGIAIVGAICLSIFLKQPKMTEPTEEELATMSVMEPTSAPSEAEDPEASKPAETTESVPEKTEPIDETAWEPEFTDDANYQVEVMGLDDRIKEILGDDIDTLTEVLSKRIIEQGGYGRPDKIFLVSYVDRWQSHVPMTFGVEGSSDTIIVTYYTTDRTFEIGQ